MRPRSTTPILLVLLLLLAAILAACGQAAAPAASPTQPASEPAGSTAAPAESSGEGEASGEPFRIALVLPSKINDYGIGQSIYQSVLAVQQEMGEENLQFVYSENLGNVDEAATAIRDYASQGYNLVIAGGSQYGTALSEIAPDFPTTSFAWGTTVDTFGQPNIYSFTGNSDEGGYVGGIIAGMLAKSGKIGYVGPIETGGPKREAEGFVNGVKASNPDAEVSVVWTGSFGDASLASTAAQTHIENGADVLAGAAQMAVGAVTVAQQNGVPWFGQQANFTSLAPDIVYGSAVYHFEDMYMEMIENIKAGVYGGKVYVGTLANGGMRVELNPDFPLPDDVKAAAEEAIQGIIDGTVETGVPPQEIQ